MNKDVDNIRRLVTDIRYLISTDCCDETIQERIENYMSETQKNKRNNETLYWKRI